MGIQTQVFTGIFNLPGEGFLAQIRINGISTLYDVRGLQYLILDQRKLGQKTTVLELALHRVRNLQDHFAKENQQILSTEKTLP